MTLAHKTDYDTLTTTGLPERGTAAWYLEKRARKMGKSRGPGRVAKFREISRHKRVTIAEILADNMPRVVESEFWFYVWNYKPLCMYCNRKLTKANRTQDHVVPRSKLKEEGLPDLGRENLVPCCEECNFQKGNKPLLVFLAERLGLQA